MTTKLLGSYAVAPRLNPATRIVNGRLSQKGDSFRIRRRTGHERHAVFSCNCGKKIIASTNNVRLGNTLSCGCLKTDLAGTHLAVHGHAQKCRKSRTYNSWLSMRRRCASKEGTRHWVYYGAKGIQVCDRWENSFEAFLEDMGERPDGMTIDRIKGNLGYTKDNCRWATGKTQRMNRS